MTPEQIREAVELAEGWEAEYDDFNDYWFLAMADGGYWHQEECDIPLMDLPRIFIAALASQLISQIDAIEDHDFESDGEGWAKVWRVYPADDFGVVAVFDGPNRDENSILACTEFLRGRK